MTTKMINQMIIKIKEMMMEKNKTIMIIQTSDLHDCISNAQLFETFVISEFMKCPYTI